MDQTLHAIWLQAKTILPQALAGLVLFALFWGFATAAHALILRLSQRMEDSRAVVVRMLGQTARVVLIVVGGLTALGTAGVDVSALIAGLGLTGFALGFALRDALSNLIAGALILFYQPFRRGQEVEVTGLRGLVIDMDLRYTRLQAPDREFLIPNSVLFNSAVIIHKK